MKYILIVIILLSILACVNIYKDKVWFDVDRNGIMINNDDIINEVINDTIKEAKTNDEILVD